MFVLQGRLTMKVASIRVYKGDAIMTVPMGYKKQRKVSVSEQRKIDKCLNCTKPMEKCKGNCFE